MFFIDKEINTQITTAQNILGHLEELYKSFSEIKHKTAKERGSNLFSGWFSGPSANQYEHENFHVKQKQLLNELLVILNDIKLQNPETCDELAMSAADIVLASKSTDKKTPEQWFMLAVESELMVFVEFYSKSSLEKIKDRILTVTPRRMLFPNQKALLEAVEKAIIVK